jgi:hypothetical protein
MLCKYTNTITRSPQVKTTLNIQAQEKFCQTIALPIGIWYIHYLVLKLSNLADLSNTYGNLIMKE